MDRGPLALFGAIVAVGLGPALWLGVQFGGVEQAPVRNQPAVIEQQPAGREVFGGTGAGGATSTQENHEVKTVPHRKAEPVTRTPSRKPSPSPSPSAEPETSEPTSPGTSTDPQQPSDPVSHPSDPTTSDDPSVPPDPPTGGDDSEDHGEHDDEQGGIIAEGYR